jgi:hypothetical protein
MRKPNKNNDIFDFYEDYLYYKKSILRFFNLTEETLFSKQFKVLLEKQDDEDPWSQTMEEWFAEYVPICGDSDCKCKKHKCDKECENKEVTNNEGREYCFKCGGKTKKIDTGFSHYTICPKCKI